MSTAIVILTRNLRLYDNLVIHAANQENDKVYCVFIITEAQFSSNNLYLSSRALANLASALTNLKQNIPIAVHTTNSFTDFLESFSERPKLYIERDFSPYALARAEYLKPINVIEDTLLAPEVKTYYKFTPFYNYVQKNILIPEPIFVSKSKLQEAPSNREALQKLHTALNPKIVNSRADGLRRLNYCISHGIKQDTQLSVYIRFGCLSARELYHKNISKEFNRSLLWRDFYFKILRDNPQLMILHGYELNKWTGSTVTFQNWTKGKTGVPIVDAAMNQLNQEGYIDNRMRMIAAYYLVRILDVNWKWGEQYFATQLVDYDWAQNAGNWLYFVDVPWSMPMFRTMDMKQQQKKFDPDCAYVKKYVPRLHNLTKSEILACY